MSEYSGYLHIEDVEYSFYINGTSLNLLPSDKNIHQFKPYSTNRFDCVFGHLYTQQQICLLNVVIQEGLFMSRKCSVAAIIKGSRNMGDDISIEPIDSITFMGEVINRFYHHFRKIDKEKTNFADDGSANIVLKPYSEVTSSHKISIGNIACSLLLSTLYLAHGNQEKETILELKSTLDLHFDKPLFCSDIKEVYTTLLNFFRFLNFRKNIGFEKIVIKKIDSDINKPVGELILLAKEENSIVPIQRAIHYEDISSRFETLFSNVISSERYILFAPKDNKEATFVNYWSYIDATTSFEYFYRKSNKDVENDIEFEKCKQLILDRIADIENNNIKSLRKKIEKLDNSSLRKRFKESLRTNKTLLENAFPKLNLNSKSMESISHSFAEQRNKIGHGDTDGLSDLNIKPYILALCIIYIMILKESGIGNNTVVTIIKNIFCNYELY